MTREDKIILLQKLIIKHNSEQTGRLHLIRPTLLKNVNVIDENNLNLYDLPSIKKSNEEINEEKKLTDNLADVNNSSDNELKSKKTKSNVSNNLKNVKELNAFIRMPREIQERYKSLKTFFLNKLDELNKQKNILIEKLLSRKQIKIAQINSKNDTLNEITTHLKQSTSATTVNENINQTNLILETITNASELTIKTSNNIINKEKETEDILFSTTNIYTESTDLIDEKENTFKPTYPSELISNEIFKFKLQNDTNNFNFQTFATQKIEQKNANYDQTTNSLNTTIQPFDNLLIKNKKKETFTLSNLDTETTELNANKLR